MADTLAGLFGNDKSKSKRQTKAKAKAKPKPKPKPKTKTKAKAKSTIDEQQYTRGVAAGLSGGTARAKTAPYLKGYMAGNKAYKAGGGTTKAQVATSRKPKPKVQVATNRKPTDVRPNALSRFWNSGMKPSALPSTVPPKASLSDSELGALATKAAREAKPARGLSDSELDTLATKIAGKLQTTRKLSDAETNILVAKLSIACKEKQGSMGASSQGGQMARRVLPERLLSKFRSPKRAADPELEAAIASYNQQKDKSAHRSKRGSTQKQDYQPMRKSRECVLSDGRGKSGVRPRF